MVKSDLYWHKTMCCACHFVWVIVCLLWKYYYIWLLSAARACRLCFIMYHVNRIPSLKSEKLWIPNFIWFQGFLVKDRAPCFENIVSEQSRLYHLLSLVGFMCLCFSLFANISAAVWKECPLNSAIWKPTLMSPLLIISTFWGIEYACFIYTPKRVTVNMLFSVSLLKFHLGYNFMTSKAVLEIWTVWRSFGDGYHCHITCKKHVDFELLLR